MQYAFTSVTSERSLSGKLSSVQTSKKRFSGLE